MYWVNVFDERWSEVDAANKIMERSARYIKPLDGWKYEKYEYTGIDQYRKLSEGEIHFHEMWDTEGTYFFTRNVEIPMSAEARDWYIEFDIDGESEVYVNDVPVGSLDTEHHDALIAQDTKGGYLVRVKIQATRHAHDFVRSKRGFGREYGYHVFKKANLVSRSRKLVEFASLVTTALQLLECDILTKENRDDLQEILKKVLYEVDYYADLDEMEVQAAAGKSRLLEMVHALKLEKNFGESLFMGHSHLDLAFKWTYKETYRKLERTLSNTVCLMDRYPKVTYIQSQMHILETIAKGYPQLFERIKKHVAGGKLEIVGDTYVEFDTNIPSGESLIRQFLLGKEIANNLMGTESKVCFLPDTFGYSGILPQILRQAGFQYFVTAKLSWNDTNQPKDLSFLWRGIDGSSVKTHLIDSYGGGPEPSRLNEQCKDPRRKTMPNRERHICQYGAGDGGGGISEDNILTIQALEELEVFSKVHQVTLEQACEMVFEGVGEDQLPQRNGELYFEKHRGVYTSQAKIKKGNRELELALQRTEALNTLFYLQGGSYGQERYIRIWKTLLLNQFHDIISGTCIHEAVEEAVAGFAQGIAECNDIAEEILAQVTKEDECITVFNPCGMTTNQIVRIKLPYPVKTLAGEMVQMIEEPKRSLDIERSNEKLINENLGEFWGVVKLPPITPFGSRILALGEKIEEYIFKGEAAECKTANPKTANLKSATLLENGRYRIEFDEQGEITSLYDKCQDRQILRGKGNVICAHVDRGGYFESWDITRDIERKVFPVDKVEYMILTEEGPLRTTLQIKKRFRDSVIMQNISIFEGSPRIDFDTVADFREPQMLIKAGFDVDVDAPVATYDISMGNLERETTRNNSFEQAKFEVLTHKFMDLSEEDHGVAILNNCKYGCDVTGSQMRITLIKTASFPDETQDIGKHEFCYSLYPHAGNMKEAKVREEAYRLNQPAVAVYGVSMLPSDPVACMEDGIMIETLKKAEQGEAVILRLYEHYGEKHKFEIQWDLPMAKVIKCNILEQEIEGEIHAADGKIILAIDPYEIVTLKIYQ